MKKLVGMILLSVSCLSLTAFAEEKGTMEKAQDKVEKAYDHSKTAVKKAYRNAKDETCEMINGKLECAGQKIKHKAQNVKDEAKLKVKDATR